MFNKVPHQHLLHKLQYYGVGNKTLKLIQSFLTDRKQQVALEGTLSSSATVLLGVPKGTVLGPLLFLTCINNLPDAVQHSSARFSADDSLLYRRTKDQQDQALLQEDFDSLEEWEYMWRMEFKPSKYNVICIMPNKQRKVLTSSHFLHGQTLETTNASKYLGITISSVLSWSTHVEDVAAWGNRTVGFLQRKYRECTPKDKSVTYTTTVRPTLEYVSAVWDSHKQKDIRLLEKVQRWAAWYVTNNYTDRSPGTVTPMLEYLMWSNLEHRRRQVCLGMLYKINKGLVNINPASFFLHFDPRTRGTQRLYQEETQHPVLFHSFFPRTVYKWNLFPTSISSAPSLESFQSRLVRSPHLSMNIKIMYIVFTTSAPVFCFNKTQGTDRDHLLTHIAAGLAMLCESPVLHRKKSRLADDVLNVTMITP